MLVTQATAQGPGRHGAARSRRYPAIMRWLLAFIVLRTALGADHEFAPLREHSQAVMPALMALSRGDPSAFTALPAQLFSAAHGVPDLDDPALIRRWTAVLPAALARLSDSTRATVMMALDQRCRLLLGDARDPTDQARIAVAFLPAPSAVALLDSAADRAFDRGDFRRYLSIAALTGSRDRQREEVALSLLTGGPLAVPGTPRSNPPPPPPLRAGLAVRWSVVPGWLLARDPWDGVRWQYRLDAQAEVVTGDGGALVRDSRGLRLIAEDGRASPLPPAPSTARLLAVAGGAAWFATGRSVHRLDFAAAQLVSIELPAEPLAPPLVRGSDSLWLTAEDLVLVRGALVANRIRHGLAPAPGWSLGGEGEQVQIIASDGRSWQISDLEAQLDTATPAERLALLVRARRLDEALAWFASNPGLAEDPASRHLALIAHLAGDRAALRAKAAELLALATTAQDQATVLAALELDDDLTALCAAQPEVLIPVGNVAWDAEPETWHHLLTGRAWSERAGLTTWLAVPPAQRRGLGPAIRSAEPPLPLRQGDGSWLNGPYRVRCEASIAHTTVECHERDGGLRWRHRWPALDPLVAPGRALALRDTWIVLVEGAARVRVLDLGNGALLADLPLHGADLAPETVVPLGDNRLADLGPLGLDTVLHLRDRSACVNQPLPVPGRWLLPWGDQVLVALQDGRFLTLPDGQTLALPEQLRVGPPPSISAAGVTAAGLQWAWQR